jgi:formylglycine-generating enzyme required for sulfatase activity
MKTLAHSSLLLTVAFLLCFPAPRADAQALNYGPLLYQDDFSVSNSLWRFTLVDTRGNQAAIDASYGKIEGGVLALKANVGCGWDYLGSIASLQLPLPTNYVIEYRARKMQWCGSFRTDISETPGTVGDSHFNPPAMEFGMAGNWFGNVCAWRTWDDQTCIPPTTGTQNNGQWYDYRIVKNANSFKVYLNGSLQWAYSGSILPGGFLHFGTGQAGSTAEVDDLKIYAIAPSLQIEVAAVRLRWFAESNTTYQIQWATNTQNWVNLSTVLGYGNMTNLVDWTDGDRRFYRYFHVPSNPDPTNLVGIPAGSFTMGSPDNETDRDSDEGPQTHVAFANYFWMAKYEVTQRDYLAVMGSNPSRFTGDLNLPVEQVSWSAANSYCANLTTREQTAGRLPVGYVYRLPTEAEWEYACRAGTTTRFSWGDDPGYALLGNYAWYGPNSGGVAGFFTHPVGLKPANPWGLYDMNGNVWEWCWDWGAPALPGGSVTDPVGAASGISRILRGGWWSDPGGAICRSASRNGSGGSHYTFGFRVVLAKPIQ